MSVSVYMHDDTCFLADLLQLRFCILFICYLIIFVFCYFLQDGKSCLNDVSYSPFLFSLTLKRPHPVLGTCKVDFGNSAFQSL